METYSLTLDFRKGVGLFGPRAFIRVKAYSGDEGEIHISPECVTADEVEEEVNRLKNELDAILRSARQNLP